MGYADLLEDVSIHAPRAGCDFVLIADASAYPRFQFTHPVRGATYNWTLSELLQEFQFTHPVRGATLGRDIYHIFCEFQFTHPVRGATSAAI